MASAVACGGGTADDAGSALDGGSADGGMRSDASAAECGNSIVDVDEQCDDGNATAFDGCDPGCTLTCEDDSECANPNECDGVETCTPCATEDCAAGRACVSGDPPRDRTECTRAGGEAGVCHGADCVMAGCGNAVVEEGESCDDGNTMTRDGCENDCRFTCEAVDPSDVNTWYIDCDDDGYATAAAGMDACLEPQPLATCAGGWTLLPPVAGQADCVDTNPAIHPGADEICDGADDDCDDDIDDGVRNACGLCGPVPEEVCNSIDDDCDGSTNEGVGTLWYRDVDGDGYGNAADSIQACERPPEYVADSSDCCDTDARAKPGGAAQSTPRTGGCGGDPWDFNCDGVATQTDPAVNLFTSCVNWDGFCITCQPQSSGGCLVGGGGWCGSVPSCGVTGTYASGDGCPQNPPTCSGTPACLARTQTCR